MASSIWMRKAIMHAKAITFGSFILLSAYGTYRFGTTLKHWIQRAERKHMYEIEDYIEHKYIESDKLQHQKLQQQRK